MSLPGSPTKNRGRLHQALRPLLPAPATGEDQPIASTSSLLEGATQLPLAEQPPRTESGSALSITSALSQEEQSQISFDFDPLPADIDLNFDRPYHHSDHNITSSTPAPILEPQPVDPALSSTESQPSGASLSLTANKYLLKEPCPFTGNLRGALPPPAPVVTEAQTSSAPSIFDNTPGQTTYPAVPPAPFSHGYAYPPPPAPGAPLLPIPSQRQSRKRKATGSSGSNERSKKSKNSRSKSTFKTPDTPRPQTTAPPFADPQTRSEGYLLPPSLDTLKRLASELDDYTAPCPPGKRSRLEQISEQLNAQPSEELLVPKDGPESLLIQTLVKVNHDNPLMRSLLIGGFRDAQNMSALQSCIYQNAPIIHQPTGQQTLTDQASVDQASVDQASVDQASNKKDSNKKGGKKASTKKAPTDTMSTSETPVEQPSQPYAMPAAYPAGYPNPALPYTGQPLVHVRHDLEDLGEFSDPDVYRKLKFGSMLLPSANLAVPKDLPGPERYKRFKNIQEELARQDSIAPILPPSELSPQDPKGFTPKPYNVPDDIEDQRVHEFFAQKNKELCTRNKQVDLERNNMAAKGTRQRREESLSQYRTISRDLAIERNWWRLKFASLGGDPTEFDNFTEHIRRDMYTEMEERMEKLEKEAAKKTKREKSKAQAAITSQNNKLAKQDVQRQNKEIKQVVSAFSAGDYVAIERMREADYDAKANSYRKPRTKQPSKRARKTANTDKDKDTDAEVETPEVETPADNATGDVAGDPSNAENIDSNMFGLDDVARANTELTAPDTNVASQSVYPSIEDAQPSNNFVFNPAPNFDSNVQTQGDQPSDDEELGDTEHNDLRRMPSNVTMFDAPTDGTHIATSMAHPGLMPTMMDQSAIWAPPPSFDSSTLPPTQFNPQLNGPMGDMMMPPGDMHAPVNGMSMVPANKMDFNYHGHMNDVGQVAPAYMNSDFQGPMNGINASSSQNLNQPWFNPTGNAESHAFDPALPVISQSIEHPQQTITTNNTGPSDTFDHNADPSTFPDPHDEIFFGNYLGDMNSSQN